MVLQVDIARRLLPVGLVRVNQAVSQTHPFCFSGQPQGLAGYGTLPSAERLGLQKIDLHRPVPGHVDLFDHTAQPIVTLSRGSPESGVFGLLELEPLPALISPPFLRSVPTVFHKTEILPVTHQHRAGLKGIDLLFVLAILVVPAVEGMVSGLAQQYGSSGHRQPCIGRGLTRHRTDRPKRM